jgi:thioredoxin reductase
MSAALVLGRARRRVVLYDHGRYRNAASSSLHGYLSRDGVHPAELRRVAREELSRYPSVAIRQTEVVRARRQGSEFELEELAGQRTRCRKLLLATGLQDELPALPGLQDLLGISAFHCPYCDGWELRDQALIAYGEGNQGAELAFELTLWSRDVTLCTGARRPPDALHAERLAHFGVSVRTQRISRVEAQPGSQVRVWFQDGSSMVRRALFYSEGSRQASPLGAQLGVAFTPKGGVEAGRLEATSVEGVYVAGDASRDALQAVVAAGEGAKAAVAINMALLKEDLWRDALNVAASPGAEPRI